MINNNNDFLYRQLVKLGDMMGDGLHHEPDGKWITKEYRQIAKLLGLLPKKKRTNNSKVINEAMDKRLENVNCKKCNSELKQTRSGSCRAKCVKCGTVFQLLSRKK